MLNLRILRESGRSHSILALSVGLFTVLTGSVHANMIGSDHQNFNPSANSTDFVTVHSSKTMAEGKLGLGLFLDTAVNSLPYFKDGEESPPKASMLRYRDSLTSAHLGLAYGLTDRIDAQLAVPVVLYQDVRSTSARHGEFKSPGVSDVRLSSKIGLLKQDGLGLAGIISANLNTTKDDPYTGNQSSPSFSAELAGDVNLGFVAIGANLGYRMKSAGERDGDAPVDPQDDRILYSMAFSHLVPTADGKVVAEIFGSAPTKKEMDQSGRHTTNAETLLAWKQYRSDSPLVYTGGIGTELRHSRSTPDWRIVFGVQYELDPRTNASHQQGRGVEAPKRAVESKPLPPVASIPVEKPDEVIVIRDVLFKFNSDHFLEEKSEKVMQGIVKNLKSGNGLRMLLIEGHSCSTGSDAYNLDLSQKRADRVRKMLMTRYGIAGNKIIAVGRGERYPVASNNSEAGRKQNRRVEFKIYRQAESKLSAEMNKAGK